MTAPEHEAGAAPADTAPSQPTVEERLAGAMYAHQQGDHASAERVYRAVLAQFPEHAHATHLLGMLRFHAGELEAGVALVRRSLELDAANPHAWNNLGNMLIQLRRRAEAEEAYRRAIALDDNLVAAWFNLARIYVREKKFEPALECLRHVTRVTKGVTSALQLLAHVYYAIGRPAEAHAVYRQWAEEVPDDPTPRHMQAAISGEDVPDRADDRFIVKIFDGFATSFDTQLSRLGYRAPELVTASLIHHPLYLTGRATVLDAGCGTGWCGPLLKASAARLVGVDLSPKMLERARARAVYDELHEAELTAFMAARTGAFDIIVSADVLCYFGKLEEVARAARASLRAAGLLCFSVEALPEGADPEFRIGTHGRYAHSRAYLERVLADAGFATVQLDQAVLRQELDAPVHGYIVVATRAEP